MLLIATALSAAPEHLVVSGYLGQSQPVGTPPLPFAGAAGVAFAPDGQMWVVAGNQATILARHGEGWSVVGSVKLPDGVTHLGAKSDGQRLYAACWDNKIHAVDLRTRQLTAVATTEKGTRSFAVAPAGLTAGFAAKGQVFTLEGDTVHAFANGQPAGAVLTLSRPADAKWWWDALGVEPVTGDLLVGSYWPDSMVYRYAPSGPVTGDGWPRKVGARALTFLGDTAWAISSGGGATALPRVLRAGDAPALESAWTWYGAGLAADPQRGYWLASSQGVTAYDARGRALGRRLGGVSGVGHLAVAGDGTLIATTENRQRMLRGSIADEPDAPLLGNANEPWRVGNGWNGAAAGLCWDGERFLVLDQPGKMLWRFDPWHTGYAEKPWEKLTAPGALTDPRALAVGDVRMWLLDGAKLLEGAVGDPATLQALTLPECDLATVTALAAADDDRLVVGTAAGVVAFTRDGAGWRRAWQAGPFGKVTGLAADAAHVVVADAKGSVALLDAGTGAVQDTLTADRLPGGLAPTAVVLHGRWVLVADEAGQRIVRLKVR